jgi:hypothetical protein
MNIENKNGNCLATGIGFSSFIALNRYIDRRILKDSKLLNLLIYISLRVKRSAETSSDVFLPISLKVGEFIIGRLSTVEHTDLSESEYKNRFIKLQGMGIIKVIKTTNKYTLGEWLENSFIDLNLEYEVDQQNNQQTSHQSTTNNNINKSNNLNSLINMFIKRYVTNKSTYTNEQYEHVLREYMRCKGIELKGKEVIDTLFVIKKMFDSVRTPEQIVNFMEWLKKFENDEDHIWIKTWTINTVQKKLPEHLSGKLKIQTTENAYPAYE